MDDKLCLLVVIGSDETGRKEVLAVIDGVKFEDGNPVENDQQQEVVSKAIHQI